MPTTRRVAKKLFASSLFLRGSPYLEMLKKESEAMKKYLVIFAAIAAVFWVALPLLAQAQYYQPNYSQQYQPNYAPQYQPPANNFQNFNGKPYTFPQRGPLGTQQMIYDYGKGYHVPQGGHHED